MDRIKKASEIKLIMKKFIKKVSDISKKIFNQLSGMNEQYMQTAMGIEFRKNKIKFMREAGLELFYDNHPIGLHELDFLIMPCLDIKNPLIIEVKVSTGLTEEHRQQLKNYLRSASKNENIIIKKVTDGLLVNFKKNETFVQSSRKKKEIQDIEIELWNLKKNKMVKVFPDTETNLDNK